MYKKYPLNEYLWRIEFRVPMKEGDITCYVSGTFNCFGDGSISLDRGEDYWEGYIDLPPGTYKLRIEINQYELVDTDRNPSSSPEVIRLYQSSLYHDPISDKFVANYGTFKVVRCVSKTADRKVYLIDSAGHKIRPMFTIRSSTHNIFEFLTTSLDKYSFCSETDREEMVGPFSCKVDILKIPSPDVIYQIFPDRFARSGNLDINFKNWNELPDPKSFFGGNITGIIEKLPYIQHLGVNHIYFTPFYKSHSNHRYDVDDYFEVDPVFGTLEDLRRLSKAMKDRGIELIIDIVFNHTSTFFNKFTEAIANPLGPDGKWYYFLVSKPKPHIGRWENSERKIKADYECFKDVASMPKLNHSNTSVREMMLDVMNFYAKMLNISFMRYDVADSIDMRSIEYVLNKFREQHPEILHIAEIWCLSPLFIGQGHYDSAMNYPLRDTIISLISGKISYRKFNSDLLRTRITIGEYASKRLMNLLGSHDTERIKTRLGSSDAALLAYSILFVLDGMPTIYYGDETGMDGGKDPDCRRTFPWDNINLEMYDKFKKMIEIRKRNNATRSGYARLSRKKNGIFKLTKMGANSVVYLFFSLSNEPILENTFEYQASNNVELNGEYLIFRKYSYCVTEKWKSEPQSIKTEPST